MRNWGDNKSQVAMHAVAVKKEGIIVGGLPKYLVLVE